MTARIIDGNALSQELRGKVAAEVARLASEHAVVPGLAVVHVGDDPASAVYVRRKMAHATEAGIRFRLHDLPAETSEAELLLLIARLNADPEVHGILVQLPLPAHIAPLKVSAAIDPHKDVDGLHPLNAGRLALGMPALVPCTPLGCLLLTRTVRPSLEGCDALVIGRSNIVGKPLAQLLMAANATVTVAHSRSRDLPALTRRADLVYAAAGKAGLVRGAWIKPGAVVIDVGTHRAVQPDGKARLVGDVDFAEAVEVAGAITPVPGGVGPMTLAYLLVNTLQAACAIAGLTAPAIG
jgi:methylenetetrahydrofolate dehydrogenase (NADP+)/methenyltetrahydrofolate cyclohydrolase